MESGRRGKGRALAALLVGALALRLPLAFLSAAPPATERGVLTRLAARGGAVDTSVLLAGDKVKAMSPEDEQYYTGTLEEDKGNGIWTVRWDVGWPETNDISDEQIKKLYFFTDYRVGDDCKAVSPDDEQWYPGTVAALLGDDKFRVKWDDPDGGPETTDVHYQGMRRVTVKRDYQQGDEVLASYPDEGTMYDATVVRQNDDGTFQVKWDDPDGGPEASNVSPKSMKLRPIPLEDIKVGQKFEGTVLEVRESFAFVDIGAQSRGFLHVDKATRVLGPKIGDLLEEDQEVTVWISGVSLAEGKVGLTMIEGMRDSIGRPPSDFEAFAKLSPDDWYDGVVDRIAPFGAFVWVDLGGGSGGSGLCHLRQLVPEGGVVEDWAQARGEDWVSVGETIRVRVALVDVERGRIALTRKKVSAQAVGAPPAGGVAADGGGGGGARPRRDVSAFVGVHGWLDGKVINTKKFGVFVEITAPNGAVWSGMLHAKRMRRGFVRDATEEFSVGDDARVRIYNVDTVAGRIDLTMMP